MRTIKDLIARQLAISYYKKRGCEITAVESQPFDLIASLQDKVIVCKVIAKRKPDWSEDKILLGKEEKEEIKKSAEKYLCENSLAHFDTSYEILECYWQTRLIVHIVNAF